MKTVGGFTVVEMAVVLALVALLAGLVLAHWSLFAGSMVRAEADALHATCMYLQRCAYVSNKPEKLTFDLQKQAYCYQGHEQLLSSSVRFGTQAHVYGPPSHPTKHVVHPITFKNNSITFWPQGSMQAGTVYLADRTKQHQYALSCAVSSVPYLRTYWHSQGQWQVMA